MSKITLTFDNGPTAETTPDVLEILASHRIPALFFVLGEKMATPELRQLAVRAHAEGHRIGNHTYSHSIPFGELADPQEGVREIVQTEASISTLAGTERLFRPFGGGGNIDKRLLNKTVLDHLIVEKYTLALWTSVPRDWEDPAGWVETALANCADQEHSVIVLHDIPTGAMRRLDYFLGAARDRGMSFEQNLPITVTPLLRGRCLADLQYITSDPS
jgi:peptidoglycan/xylan/chitin deacetylase (PgdA/CDA1 family)